jgi:hypothetical protein
VKGRVRRLWPTIAAVVLMAAALSVLYSVWRSKDRIDLAIYGAFAIALMALVLGWIAWVWRVGNPKADLSAESRDLDARADRLAEVVLDQWTRSATERGLLTPEPIPVRWGRPSLPLAGPAAAAADSRRFDPLPGIRPAEERRLATGQIDELHSIYGGLGSGRLVIAGAPGSGKSGVAVLLIRAALLHRQQVADADRPRVPVLLLFTAQDWDPVNQRIADWLAQKMRQAYQMFVGNAGAAVAATLVAAGRVGLILDGLDEMAEKLRPVALRALSQQAAFRVVVLSRTAEMASAASRQGILEGAAAIELLPVDHRTAASYLSRVQLDPPPDSWRDLVDRVRSGKSPLVLALDNPLTLTLVRDTYRAGDDVRELLELCDDRQRVMPPDRLAEDITDHLLDRVLPTAYTARPGESTPTYDLQVAQRSLKKIAARMNKDHTRDLEWWHIPDWARAAWRLLAVGLTVGVAVGLTVGLTGALLTAELLRGRPAAEQYFGALLPRVGLGAGLLAGLSAALLTGLGGNAPRKAGKLRIGRALNRKSIVFGLRAGNRVGLGVGFLVALGVTLLGTGFADRLFLGIFSWLLTGLAVAPVVGLADALAGALEDPESTSALSPLTSWRADTRYMTVAVLVSVPVVGLVAGSVVGLVAGSAGGLWVGLWVGLGFGLVFGLLAGFVNVQRSAAWASSLASAQLALRWHTPVRLMRFLEDAHRKGVLRTVGPVYQFRHARLQDRLVTQDRDHHALGSEEQALARLTPGDSDSLTAD